MQEAKPDFWSRRLGPESKRALLGGLVCCFLFQTMLVYVDPTTAEPLSDQATRGREVWFSHNCQSCHQLYGFGGFLGPDLTNIHPNLTPERLNHTLTLGNEYMPAFDLPPEDIAAIAAFLEAMNASGRGQARLVSSGEAAAPRGAFEAALDVAISEPGPARIGFETIRMKGCFSCHVPLTQTRTYPDLSTVAKRLSKDEIMTTLVNGRNKMPPAELSEARREDVYAFLQWLAEHRSELREQLADSDSARTMNWLELPWWEYR